MSEEVKVETGIDKDHVLCGIKGIGPKTAEKLIEKGVTTLEQVAVMRAEELADIIGITNKVAKDMVNDAKNQALDKAIVVSSMGEEIERRKLIIKRISTGSAAWDSIMRGGIPTEAITVFKGQYASGKSQTMFQLAVNCLKQFGRKVAWVESETGTFVPERILEIAKAVNLNVDVNNDIIYVGSNNITTPYSMFLAYQRLEMDIKRKNLDVGLLCIDSFSAPFRAFYAGREMLPDRSKEEARHIGFLDYMAKKYNMAIVMSAQVMDIPDPGAQLGEKMKSGHTKHMYGGNVLEHGGTYLISLQQVAGQLWEGVVFDAPDIPKTAFRFKIIGAGIRDA